MWNTYKMTMLVIYNPSSGSGEGAKVGKLVEKELKSKGIDFTCYPTQSRDDLISYLIRNAMLYAKVIVIGGDGTIRDAIAAMNEINWPSSLGIIPAGSGNDLARFLGKNMDPVTLINRYIISEDDEYIYGARCNEKTFINVLGIGINTAILRKRVFWKKIVGGKFSYLLSSLISLILYRPKFYDIKADGVDKSDKYYIITVCNGKYFGAGMKISPDSDLYSRDLSIIALRNVSKLKLIKAFMKIYKGEHINLGYVDYYQAKEIKVKFQSDDEYLDMDGDLFNVKDVLISKTEEQSIRLLKHN